MVESHAAGSQVPPKPGASAVQFPRSGNLETTSPMTVYGWIAAAGRTGLLALEDGSVRLEIGFKRGTPEHADSSRFEDDLGAFLVAHGALKQPQLIGAQQVADKFGGNLVHALIGLRVLDPGAVFGHLAARAQGILFRALALRRGRFVFDEAAKLPETATPLGDRWALLCEAARMLSGSELRERLGPRLSCPVLRSGGQIELAQLRLSPQEMRASTYFDGVRPLQQLCQSLAAEADTILRVALLLWSCELVSFPGLPVEPMPMPPPGAASSPTRPPGGAPSEPPRLERCATPTPPPVGTRGGTIPPSAAPSASTAAVAHSPGPARPAPRPAPAPPPRVAPAPPPGPASRQATPGTAPRPAAPTTGTAPGRGPAPGVGRAPPAAARPAPAQPGPARPAGAASPAATTGNPVRPPASTESVPRAPNTRSAAVQPAPAAPAPGNPARELEQIKALIAGAQEKNCFELLGLPTNATSAQIKVAYFGLAKTLHPDTLPQGAPAQLAKLKADAFALVGEAYRTLSDDKKRAEYLEALESGESGEEEVDASAIFASEEAFQRGCVLLRARKFAEALAHFEQAITLMPREGEYHAWRAWARFLDARDKRAARNPALDGLEEAVALNPRCAQTYFFIGQVAKLTGDAAGALRWFKKTVELDANHIDAQRELRMAANNK